MGTDSAIPKERPKRDHAGFLPRASHPTRAAGHKTEHLFAVLSSPGALPARRRGLEGFIWDHCQCTAHMAFLTPYIILGCWGRNQQQPYPTAPETKIPTEASSSGLLRESHSHPNLPLCSSPSLQELAEQMGLVPWLASLEPARQQKGSGEPLLLPCRL